ncbi:hypothetical protein ACFO5X_06355 [Seohaeicola nanhaiensis]|uniref:Uncharacterized protein n=1 Tax=Seohaeicola nanhaiensis TaxID=1387282 RepID=A0ABV9KD82_9RHOB
MSVQEERIRASERFAELDAVRARAQYSFRVSALLVFLVFAFMCFIYGSMKWRWHYEAMTACVQAGGSWVPGYAMDAGCSLGGKAVDQ